MAKLPALFGTQDFRILINEVCGKTIKQVALRVEDGCFLCDVPFFTNFDILEELEVHVQVLFRLEDGDGEGDEDTL